MPTANLGNVDTSGLEADIALLAFKTQANGSLARYNLIDQSVDSFEDASGGGATGGGTDKIFHENGQTVTTNYTIGDTFGAACNAMSAGPVTINNGVTVTINNGETWIIL